MSIMDHLELQLASYRKRNELPTLPAAALLQQPDLTDQHKAWMRRHIMRADVAVMLDAYGFELQVMRGAERCALKFDNGARIIISSRSGSMLPTAQDWQIMAFKPDGHIAYEAIGSDTSSIRMRDAIEAARDRVDPTLEQLPEVR